MKSLKILVVGDDGVGKSTLLGGLMRAAGEAPPGTFENTPVVLSVDGTAATLRLFEVEKHEDNPALRCLAYPGTDVVLLCFSVIQPSSFENLTMIYGPELKAKLPTTPLVLVATKCEMRSDQATLERMRQLRMAPVTLEQTQEKARALGCVRCLESVDSGAQAQEIFLEAARVVLFPPAPPPRPARSCCGLL